jgi:hypothetical protein
MSRCDLGDILSYFHFYSKSLIIKEKDYHESTKYRKHEREVSGCTSEHRTSNAQHRMSWDKKKTYDLEERLLIIAGGGISVYFSLNG